MDNNYRPYNQEDQEPKKEFPDKSTEPGVTPEKPEPEKREGKDNWQNCSSSNRI